MFVEMKNLLSRAQCKKIIYNAAHSQVYKIVASCTFCLLSDHLCAHLRTHLFHLPLPFCQQGFL